MMDKINKKITLHLGTVYCNNKYGSQKCYSIGKYFRDVRCVSFSDLDCTSRCNNDFQIRKQPLHHKEKSPLEDLISIDMVRDFPCSDPLHLLEQGVIKRCINIWMNGKGSTSYEEKWT